MMCTYIYNNQLFSTLNILDFFATSLFLNLKDKKTQKHKFGNFKDIYDTLFYFQILTFLPPTRLLLNREKNLEPFACFT